MLWKRCYNLKLLAGHIVRNGVHIVRDRLSGYIQDGVGLHLGCNGVHIIRDGVHSVWDGGYIVRGGGQTIIRGRYTLFGTMIGGGGQTLHVQEEDTCIVRYVEHFFRGEVNLY